MEYLFGTILIGDCKKTEQLGVVGTVKLWFYTREACDHFECVSSE